MSFAEKHLNKQIDQVDRDMGEIQKLLISYVMGMFVNEGHLKKGDDANIICEFKGKSKGAFLTLNSRASIPLPVGERPVANLPAQNFPKVMEYFGALVERRELLNRSAVSANLQGQADKTVDALSLPVAQGKSLSRMCKSAMDELYDCAEVQEVRKYLPDSPPCGQEYRLGWH